MYKKRQTVYRTASTVCPCFLPDLGDSTGAGRICLPVAKLNPKYSLEKYGLHEFIKIQLTVQVF